MSYKLQSQLKEFVQKEGKQELLNEVKLLTCFGDSIKSTELHQLILVLSCDTIKDFIVNSDKYSNRVELNNLIMSVVNATGLKNSVARDYVAMLCIVIGVSFNHEIITAYDPVNESFIQTSNTLEPTIERKKLDAARLQKDSGNNDKAAEIYEELVKAGSATAMYELGMIYLEEFKAVSEKNTVLPNQSLQLKKGIKLLEIAAENGHVKARVELGNFYYFYDMRPDSLKSAFAYYSSPGIPSTDQNVKDRLIGILNQEKTNLLVTILGGIWTAIIWAFLFVCGHSVHHDSVLIGWGLVFTIIPTLIYGVMCYSLVKYKYAYNKICMFAMMIIWFVYPLILAIN